MNKKRTTSSYIRISIAILVSALMLVLTSNTSLASYPFPPNYPIYDDQSPARREDMMAIAKNYKNYKWIAKNSDGNWDLTDLRQSVEAHNPDPLIPGILFDGIPEHSFNDWHAQWKDEGLLTTPDYNWCATGIVYKTWGCWNYAPNINIGLPYFFGGRNVIRSNDVNNLNTDMPDLGLIPIDSGGNNLDYFDQKVEAGWPAGNLHIIDSNHIIANGQQVGLDCTGFVMQVWRLSSHFNPSILEDLSRPIRFADLQAGDIIYHRSNTMTQFPEPNPADTEERMLQVPLSGMGHAVMFQKWEHYDPTQGPVAGRVLWRKYQESNDGATTFWAYEASAAAKKVVLSLFRLVYAAPEVRTYNEYNGSTPLKAPTDQVAIQRIKSCSGSDNSDCLSAGYTSDWIDLSGLEYIMGGAYPRSYFNPLDVAFVIDNSGSVADNGKLEKEKTDAKAIVDLLSPGDKVAVIEFEGAGIPVINLTPIVDDTTKTTIKNQIDDIVPYADGIGTSVASGMAAAMEELEDGIFDIGNSAQWRPDPNRIILLLSDGEETIDPYVQTSFLDFLYNEDGISVYTLQEGGSGPNKLMQTIAKRTQGVYTQSLSYMIEAILARKLILQPVSSKRSNIPTTSSIHTETLAVDSSMASMVIALSWSGNPLTLNITKHNNTTINPSNGTDPNIVVESGNKYIIYKINAPGVDPGNWTLHISGDPGETFDLSISALNAMSLSAKTDKSTYLHNEPIKITVSIDDNNEPLSISEPSVPTSPKYIHNLTTREIDVEDPNHQHYTILLHDDGTKGDNIANDGIYVGVYGDGIEDSGYPEGNTSIDGLYNFDIKVAGKNNRAEEDFTRAKHLSANVVHYPTVTSITRVSQHNPVSVHTVQFEVTFSERVMNVDLSDFALTANGAPGASISNVIPKNPSYPPSPPYTRAVPPSASIYTVTVINPGTGTGTLRLDLVDDDSITNGANTPLDGVYGLGGQKLGGDGLVNGNFTSGEVYNIQNPAGGIIVNTNDDINDELCDSVHCSLREAIASVPDDGTILFDGNFFDNPNISDKIIRAGGYSGFTLSRNVTIDASTLTTPITINGDSDNNGSANVFTLISITDANVDIKNLVFTKAKEHAITNSAGKLKVINSTFINNGLSSNNSIDEDKTIHGAGIWNGWGSSMTVQNSSFINNTAPSGGAIYNRDRAFDSSITNSTFVSNTAKAWGGGIYNDGGRLFIKNSSFSANGGLYGADIFTNGYILGQLGQLYLYNSIFANAQSSSNCYIFESTIEANVNNLSEDGSCSSSLGSDPMFGALGNYGGITQTLPLLLGSPAINAGNSAVCAAAPVNNLDQRGVARPQGVICDIGAYERVDGPDPVTPTPTLTATSAITPTFTVTPTLTKTVTATPIITFTSTKTLTSTVTPTQTKTFTYTPTPTPTSTPILFTISGNAGVPWAILRYYDNAYKTAMADASGNYSLIVSYNWSGTVTLSRQGYIFSPVNRLYANVLSNQTSQNYTSTLIGWVSSGGYHGCWLRNNNSVACWGSDGSSGTPMPNPNSFVQIGTGYYYNCALKNSDSSLTCWGESSTPALPSGSFAQVSVNMSQACGIRSNGSVACWEQYSYHPIATPPSGAFVDVSAGHDFACGIKNNSTLICWGQGTTSTGSWPEYGQAMPPSGTFTQVSAGFDHACAIRTDGTLACWGAGVGNTGNSPNYGQSMPPDGTFMQISSGNHFTCGLKSNNTAVCWGINDGGQSTPPSGSFSQISAGGGHTCGIKSDGVLTCWGWNMYNAANPIKITGIAAPETTLSYTDGVLKTFTTDLGGSYTIAVSYNWSGTVLPSKANTTFIPASRSYTNLTTDQNSQNYSVPVTVTYESIAAEDGWVLESPTTPGTGGSVDNTTTLFNVGDTASNLEYRSILSFDTSSIPDNATLLTATLRFKQGGSTGASLLNTYNLWVDMAKGRFGSAFVLQNMDFDAAAVSEGLDNAAYLPWGSTPDANNWFSVNLNTNARGYINRINKTQFRFHFGGTTNNSTANILKFYTATADNIANGFAPQLIITYSLP